MMTWGHATLAKHFSDCLSQDIRAAVDLSKQEAVLHDEAVSAVVGGKRLLLFKRLLEITHFPDMRVVEIMMKGVDLTGLEPETPLRTKVLPGFDRGAGVGEGGCMEAAQTHGK